MTDSPLGIHLCDDLIFASRVSGEARAQGMTVKTARSLEEFHGLLADDSVSCVILDLHFSGLDVAKLNAELKGAPTVPRIVGYGSHVDAERLRAARVAGCDLVLPRSAFVEQLASELPRWLCREPGSA